MGSLSPSPFLSAGTRKSSRAPRLTTSSLNWSLSDTVWKDAGGVGPGGLIDAEVIDLEGGNEHRTVCCERCPIRSNRNQMGDLEQSGQVSAGLWLRFPARVGHSRSRPGPRQQGHGIQRSA